MDMDVDRVVCCGDHGNDMLTAAALMRNGSNQEWNNPFVYLIWLMFANRFFGNGWGANG